MGRCYLCFACPVICPCLLDAFSFLGGVLPFRFCLPWVGCCQLLLLALGWDADYVVACFKARCYKFKICLCWEVGCCLFCVCLPWRVGCGFHVFIAPVGRRRRSPAMAPTASPTARHSMRPNGWGGVGVGWAGGSCVPAQPMGWVRSVTLALWWALAL